MAKPKIKDCEMDLRKKEKKLELMLDDPLLLAQSDKQPMSRMAEKVMSKSNTSKASNLFQTTSISSTDPVYSTACWYPTNLLEVIRKILNTDCEKMHPVEFKFEYTKEAAEHNWNVLSKYENLGKAIDANNNSQLSYGSEFRKATVLEPLMRHHPLWNDLKSQLTNGINYPIENLSADLRKKDVEAALEYGNHKGVGKNQEFFTSAMKNEVENGWQLIIPRDKIIQIPNAILAPMNVVNQSSIDEKGNVIPKQRLTHDQGMKFDSGTSVNSRVREDEVPDVMYGHCLLRIIHLTIHYRLLYPNKRIYYGKVDSKSAYRRGHLFWEIAIQTITQCLKDDLGFISLRMTFGGSPNPALWGNISESITDLANALLRCKDWDPKELKSPLQHLVPSHEPSENPEELTKALPIDVDTLSSNCDAKADIYIDDGISVAVDEGDNVKRAEAAMLLAMHVIGRPFDADDPIPRKDIVSLSKLAAEGMMSETKMILGWLFNSNRLTISLPFEKKKAWSDAIDVMIKTKRASYKELESTTGRLGHVSTIIPYMKHFMNRIRYRLKTGANRRVLMLNHEIIEDLKLHQNFIKLASEGISMNLLTFRQITHGHRSDSCPIGLGGASSTGVGWRWKIPKHLRMRASNNVLEYLAMIVGPWFDLILGLLPKYSCICSMGDSTTAVGWMHKSNFQSNENESEEMTKVKSKIARDYAWRMIQNRLCDFPKWFNGIFNELTDSLSRDHHLSDQYLTQMYLSCIPKQVPPNFRILPLPDEITSYLSAILQTLPANTQPSEQHKISSLAHGFAGTGSYQSAESTTTPFWMNSANSQETFLSQPLHKQSETESFLNRMIGPWSARLSETPWTMYARPSESTIEETPSLTSTRRLAEFYSSSSKAIKMKIHQRNTKKPSL